MASLAHVDADALLLNAAAESAGEYLTIDEFVTRSGCSRSTTHRRLAALATMKLLKARREKRESRGRPAKEFAITDDGIAYLHSVGEELRQFADHLLANPIGLPAQDPATG